MPPSLPTFLVIGAAKSGTTSLAMYLAAHPEVFVASRKEVRFFDRHWDEGLDWYRGHFAKAGSAKAIGEASPAYFTNPDTVARVAATLPGVRAVALLRDPVARAVSAYHFAVGLGLETRTLDDALVADGDGSFRPLYLETGHYATHLERWFGALGRDAVHVELFEDLAAHPAPVFARVCDHLGVDSGVLPANLGEVFHESYRIRWRWYRELTTRTLRTWDRLPLRLAYRVSELNRVKTAYAPPPPALVARLREHFAPHDAALVELLGRPLPWG